MASEREWLLLMAARCLPVAEQREEKGFHTDLPVFDKVSLEYSFLADCKMAKGRLPAAGGRTPRQKPENP